MKKPTTSALSKKTAEFVKEKLGDAFATTHVRSSSINSNGHCVFYFTGIKANSVAVGVAYRNTSADPIGYYVIPGAKCPKILLVKPGSESSKWYIYWCKTENEMKRRVGEVHATKLSRAQKGMLERLA